MGNNIKTAEWLKSDEVKKILKIRACDITHMRDAGKLQYTKQGNAFLYSSESVAKNIKK